MRKSLNYLMILIAAIFISSQVCLAVEISRAYHHDAAAFKFTAPSNCSDECKKDIGTKYQYGSIDYLELKDGNTAYCMDPGLNDVRTNSYKCSEINNINPEFEKALKYLFSQENLSKETISLAVKMLSVYTSNNNFDGVSKFQQCAYIAMASQTLRNLGYDGDMGYDVKTYGINCQDIKVTGNSASSQKDNANAALTQSGKAIEYVFQNSEDKSVTHNVDIETSELGDKVIIKITNKDKIKVDYYAECGSNIKSEGSSKCNEKITIEDNATFIYTLSGDTCNDNSKVKATISYVEKETDNSNQQKLGSNECTEVKSYSCTNNRVSTNVQNYVSCTARKSDSNGNGTGNDNNDSNGIVNKTKTKTGTINCNNNKPKPTPTKEKCSVIPDDFIHTNSKSGTATSLCNGEAGIVLSVNEASAYEKLLKNNECTLSGVVDPYYEDLTYKGLCATYCLEDYQFYSYGLRLSPDDYKEGKSIITAGSYFNLANPKAVDQSSIKCFTVFDYDVFNALIEQEANDYAKKISDTEYTCTYKSNYKPIWDEETQTYIDNWEDAWELYSKANTVSASYSNYRVSFTSTPGVSQLEETYNSFSECQAEIIKRTETDSKDTGSAYQTYRNNVNKIIGAINTCVNKGSEKYELSETCETSPTAIFDYGLGQEAVEYKPSNVISEISDTKYNLDGTEYDSKPSGWWNEKHIDLNIDRPSDQSDSFIPIDLITNVTTVTGNYDLKGEKICNDYNKQEMYYGSRFDLSEGCNNPGQKLIYGFPVPYQTPNGTYTYSLKIDGFGYLGKDNTCGRLANDYRNTIDNMNGNYDDAGCSYVVNGTGDDCPESNPNCKHKCEIVDGTYYGSDGSIVTLEQFKIQCRDSLKCRCFGDDGKSDCYDNNGESVTPDNYQKVCPNDDPNARKCKVIGNTYYGEDGKSVSKEVYEKQCKKDEPCKYPNCPWTCPPDQICNPTTKCEGECPWICIGVGCIYNESNGLLLNYQPISLINIDSTFAFLLDKYDGVMALSNAKTRIENAAKEVNVQKISLADNSVNSVNSYNWGSPKGIYTLNRIADKGEKIYNEEPEYRIKLTPADISAIKEYNSKNTYIDNDSLKCKMVENNADYFICESEFLNKLNSDITKRDSMTIRGNTFTSFYNNADGIEIKAKSGTGPAWK